MVESRRLRVSQVARLQIHGKVSTADNDTGSNGRALNTAVQGGARGFCRQGGRGNGGRHSLNGNNRWSNGNKAMVVSTRRTRTYAHTRKEEQVTQVHPVGDETVQTPYEQVEGEADARTMAETIKKMPQ